MFKKLFIFAVIVGIGIFAWRLAEENLAGPRVKIGDHAFSVQIADTNDERIQGLSGQPPLRSNEGMVFIFPKPDLYGFWMQGMAFPIDIIWIKDNRVIGFEEDLEPDSNPVPKIYRPPTLVDQVLEVKAGQVKERGISINDPVTFELNN